MKKPKPGPVPDHLRVERDDWEDAVKKALDKKRPPSGWPKPEKPAPKSKKRKKAR